MRNPASNAICIVEDDEAVRDSLGELLRSHGFVVHDYDSPFSFLANEERAIGNCACLIVDLHMPGMNGLELLELLRKRHATIPVVVVTGRSDSSLKDRARRSDAIALLDKPVDEDALLGAIADALHKTSEKIPVTLKTIRLELARSATTPEGDPSHAYTFRAPLDESGHIDQAGWDRQRELCIVHRFEHGRVVEVGSLRRTGPGRWVFSYAPGEDDDEPVFRLSQHMFAPGQYVTITEHDGVARTFKVSSVEEWHPQAAVTRAAPGVGKRAR